MKTIEKTGTVIPVQFNIDTAVHNELLKIQLDLKLKGIKKDLKELYPECVEKGLPSVKKEYGIE